MEKTAEKSKEQILAERQAKKAAKPQVKKPDAASSPSVKPEVKTTQSSSPAKVAAVPKAKLPAKVSAPAPIVNKEKPTVVQVQPPKEADKDKDKIHAEREAKKLAKQAAKKKVETTTKTISTEAKVETKAPVVKPAAVNEVTEKIESMKIAEDHADKAKPVLSKAERRAIQEAQRAAKAKALEDKKTVKPSEKKTSDASAKKTHASPPTTTPHKAATSPSSKSSAVHKVKLFKHLYSDKCDVNINVNGSLHPAIIKLGLQYKSDSVVGSNARCFAFLNAMKIVSRSVSKFHHFG